MNNTLIQFTLLIKVAGRLREFNFRKRSEDRYEGNTPDERGERFYFTIQKEADIWSFRGDALPAWIREGAEEITRALVEKENEFHTL